MGPCCCAAIDIHTVKAPRKIKNVVAARPMFFIPTSNKLPAMALSFTFFLCVLCALCVRNPFHVNEKKFFTTEPTENGEKAIQCASKSNLPALDALHSYWSFTPVPRLPSIN